MKWKEHSVLIILLGMWALMVLCSILGAEADRLEYQTLGGEEEITLIIKCGVALFIAVIFEVWLVVKLTYDDLQAKGLKYLILFASFLFAVFYGYIFPGKAAPYFFLKCNQPTEFANPTVQTYTIKRVREKNCGTRNWDKCKRHYLEIIVDGKTEEIMAPKTPEEVKPERGGKVRISVVPGRLGYPYIVHSEYVTNTDTH